MAKKSSKKTGEIPVKVVGYRIQKPQSDGTMYHRYNIVDAVDNIHKLYGYLFREIREEADSIDKSNKTNNKGKMEKLIFCETSRAHNLLVAINRDCDENDLNSIAYQVSNTFYECMCLAQIVAGKRRLGVGQKEERKTKQNVSRNVHQFLETRMHKGHILFDIANICLKMGWTWHHRYFLILTLVEDALTHFFLVHNGPIFCRILIANKEKLNSFYSADENQSRKGEKDDEIDVYYLKYLVSPKAEDLWREPDQPDAGGIKIVEQLERRIARFWMRTGLCQWLRRSLGFGLPDVMALVVKIAEKVFVNVSTKKGGMGNNSTPRHGSPVGAYHRQDDISFANGCNSKRIGWGPIWLGFPEWVASQSGLLGAMSSPISQDEVFVSPFNSAYYGYLCKSLIPSVGDEELAGKKATARHVGSRNNTVGLLFEELSAYLCQATPGVRVVRNSQSGTGEIDIIGYVANGSSYLHPVTGNHFIGECKWNGRSAAVDVVDVLSARAKRMRADSAIVFSRKGISGEGTGDNAERVIHTESMNGVCFAPLSEDDLKMRDAARIFSRCVDDSKFLTELDSLRDCLNLVRLRFPLILRDSFDRHRFGFYGSHSAK